MKTMQKLIFFLFLITISSINFGQTYLSCFGIDTTKWTEIVQNEWPMSIELSINGTTTYNNNEYKTLNGICALRQDSSNSKLFVISLNYDQGEKLIMDLNLIVGDTFFYDIDGVYPDTAIVDSIYYWNNRKVIQFNKQVSYFGGSLEKFKFIEGIGTNKGITYSLGGLWAESPYLLCCKNDTFNYLSSFYQSCDYYFVNVNKMDYNIDFKIVNPIDEFLRIELNNCSTFYYQLFDYTGKLINAETVTNSIVEINMVNYSSGFYVIKIRDNTERLFQKKIVKLNKL